MDFYQEPQSSQPPGFNDIQRDLLLSTTRTELGWVRYHDAKRPDLSAIVPQAASDPSAKNRSRPSHRVPPIDTAALRRPGNANHPAHQSRHAVFLPETQDPEVDEAVREFNGRKQHTFDFVYEVSKRKAARIDPAFKENRAEYAGTTLQRRRTTEDIQAPSQGLPTKKNALKSRATESRLCSARAQRVHDSPMEEDEPVAGPSAPIFQCPSLTSFEEEEDDVMPSSTPTPPPKRRIPQRSVSTASSSSPSSLPQSKYAAFSESPTSLFQTPLSRRHSEDPSTSYSSTRNDSVSPIEQKSSSQRSIEEEPLSPVIPSPVALAQQSAFAMPPPSAPARALPQHPPEPSFPPPSSFRHSQTAFSQPSQAPAPSRLPPNVTQSPALSRPYIMPSLSQGLSASQLAGPPRPSQRRPPPLGMRPAAYGGVGKYKVSNQHPKAIAGFKVPFKKNGPVAGAGAASGSGSGIRTAANASAHTAVVTVQRSVSPVVPDPPFAVARAHSCVGSTTANGAQVPQLKMSARRAEPSDDMDLDETGKEADSSYGDISFDFDPEALDEAMSMYDA